MLFLLLQAAERKDDDYENEGVSDGCNIDVVVAAVAAAAVVVVVVVVDDDVVDDDDDDDNDDGGVHTPR
eukprot:2620777-Pleurochrysis_carterae.AAC.1